MNKFFTLFIAFFFSITLFGQKDTLSIPINYKAKMYSKKESLAISNIKTNEMVVLIEDSKTTNLYLFDQNGQKKGELSTKRLKAKFRNFVGHHLYSDGSYAIVFSNISSAKTGGIPGIAQINSEKFGVLKFNFETKTISQELLSFKFSKEKYVESITQNNTFYIMTVARGISNDVNFHVLQDDNSFKKNTVSFESVCYKSKLGVKKRPIDILTTRYFYNGSLTKIDPNSPNSIETTSDKNKLYQKENHFLFTFDNDEEQTNMLKINLSDFSFEKQNFKKPLLQLIDDDKKISNSHNSYIDDDLLFQVKTNRKQMRLTVSNLATGNLIKEFEVKKGDSISFKNGPIIQEKEGAVMMGKERKLEKTAKFLRKTTIGHAGISSVNIEGKLQLTVGAFILRTNNYNSFGNNGVANSSAGTPAGHLPNYGFNPTYNSYYSYSSSKTTYINCLFDDGFNPLKGEIKDNIFDVIKGYEKAFDYNERVVKQEANGSKYVTPARMKLKNVFYHNGDHYLGYLNTLDRNYHLVKF